MKQFPLLQLIKELENELVRLGYSNGSMKFYKNRWQKLLDFALRNNHVFFTEQLGIDFLETNFQISQKDFNRTLSQKDTQELRVIRMIGDYQIHHSVLRRYYKHHNLLSNPYFINISKDFKNYCTQKDYSKVTVDHYVKQTIKFLDYLVSQGVDDCQNITLVLVHSYIKTLLGYSYKTVEQCICAIRCFLRYLL